MQSQRTVSKISKELKKLNIKKVKHQNFKNGLGGVCEEMTQWIRALTAHPEDLSSVPRTHRAAHNSLAPVPRDLMPSASLHRNKVTMWWLDIDAGGEGYRIRQKRHTDHLVDKNNLIEYHNQNKCKV